MIEQTPDRQLNQKDNQAESVGLVAFPDGVTAQWLTGKTKHLNTSFKTWFDTTLLGIEDNYKLYRGNAIAGTLPNGTTIPIVTSIVDTMTGRVVTSLVPRETFVSAIAVDPDLQMQSDHNKQEVVTDFINETISTTDGFADKADETIKMLMLENVAVVEAKWTISKRQELVAQRTPDPMTPMGEPHPITGMVQQEYEIGRPDFEPVSIRMMAWDPRCKTGLADSPWVRKRSMASINELFRMQEDGIIESVDEIVQRAGKALSPDNPSDPDAKQSQAVDSKQLPSVGWDDGVWELDEWWATLAWKHDGIHRQAEYQFWIVGGDTVVKFRPNPLIPQRKPFATIKASRQPGQLLGIGPVTVIKSMQRALNNNMSRLEQLVNNSANSPTFYEPSSGMDGRSVSLQSNSLIPVLSVQGIKRFEPATQAIELISNFIQFIIRQMREATAANDQSQGIGQEADTATEAQILAQGSNGRFGYITEMINNSMFGSIANEYFLLWKQFGEPGKMIVKDGSNDGKGYRVQPEDLAGCYIFKAVPTQTQQAKVAHFGQLKGLLQDIMQLQAGAPGAMVNNEGVPQQLQVYDFLANNMLPLVNVQPRGLFKDAPPPPTGPTGATGMPPMGAGNPIPSPSESPSQTDPAQGIV